MEDLFSNEITDTPGRSPAPGTVRAGPSRRPPTPRRGRSTLAVMLALALAGLLAFLAGGGANQLASRAPVLRLSHLIAAPLSQAGPPPGDSQEATIQGVIQRADTEQAQAIAARDPSAMADTSTSAHYQELVGINQDLLDHGVTSIALVRVDWGPITVSGTTASATVDETWSTTYADSTTEQSRDRNVYTLVQENGAWKIQADDHPGSPGPAGAWAPPARQPQPQAVAVPPDQATSHNWSGYAATGGAFSAVSGTWTVPDPATEGPFGADAVWVGIGGVRSRDLIQAGTDEAVSGAGQAVFQAWIEMLPQVARPVPLVVHPGDSVTVSITQQGADNWLVAFANNTTGQKYQQTERYASSGSSAEWVVEAPFSNRGLLPLDNFGSVGFSDGSAVKDGRTVTIAEAGARPITMLGQQDQALAVPSSLGDGRASFSVNRTAAPATGQGGSPDGRRGSGPRRQAAGR
jgi:hypothetical protein